MNLTLEHLPEQLPLSLKALGTARRRPPADVELPQLSVELASFHFDPELLRAYRDICGFPESEVVPIPYPQVSAIGLQMYLLTQPQFPLPLLGLVHIRNSIHQDRPLQEDGSYSVRVAVGTSRRSDKGLEFQIETDYFDAHQNVVWKSVATVLSRAKKKKSGGNRKPARDHQPDGLTEYRAFDVPGDLGRRYGRISGDMNPIHLYPLTAKLFGFRRHIAHGMWTMARCCALLQEGLGHEPTDLETQFRQPLFLPARAALRCAREDSSFRFALLGMHSGKLHLEGTVR